MGFLVLTFLCMFGSFHNKRLKVKDMMGERENFQTTMFSEEEKQMLALWAVLFSSASPLNRIFLAVSGTGGAVSPAHLHRLSCQWPLGVNSLFEERV